MLTVRLDPSDDVLKEALEKYAREGLSRPQKLARLGLDLDLYIGYDTHRFAAGARLIHSVGSLN